MISVSPLLQTKIVNTCNKIAVEIIALTTEQKKIVDEQQVVVGKNSQLTFFSTVVSSNSDAVSPSANIKCLFSREKRVNM